jgi:integrase
MDLAPEDHLLDAARAKRKAMRSGGRSVGYDGIVVTHLGNRYLVRVWDPYRKKYTGSRHPNRREAEAWGRRMRADLLSRKTTSEAPTLRLAAATYLRDLRTSGASLASLRIVALACAKAIDAGFDDMLAPKYRQRLQEWLGELKADKASNPAVRSIMAEWMPEITVNEAAEPKVRRTTRTELSASSRNTYLRCLRTVIKQAARDGEFADPLAGARGFKVDKTTKPVFTPPELRLLLSDEHREHPAWLGTAQLLYTGCRIDEGLHIRWKDVDFTGTWVLKTCRHGCTQAGWLTA